MSRAKVLLLGNRIGKAVWLKLQFLLPVSATFLGRLRSGPLLSDILCLVHGENSLHY